MTFTFSESQDFIMPIGQHKGECLDEIAIDNEGLKYLDWLRGERASERQNTDLDRALESYLSDPAIRKDLEAL